MPILKEPAIFRKYIDGMLHLSKVSSQTDFTNLRLLLGSICLRRSKAILSLFGLTMEERRPQFSPLEREEYNLLLQKGRIALDIALSGHNTKETHQRVIEALLRLRLYCNNGSPQENDRHSASPLDLDETLSLIQQSGEAVCKYCSCDILSISFCEGPDFVHMTECRRLICGECVPQYHQDFKKAQKEGKESCPFCSDKHCADSLFRKETGKYAAGKASRKIYPSKLIALLEDILKNPLHEKRYQSGPELLLIELLAHNQDSIIFSFWKKSLDLVGDLFDANGIRYCRVDGSLSLGKCRTVLLEFRGNPEVRVLIMTLGTGAVG
jgi:SWI/SNF-related matrix-associated actin-dependent regulator of chromatin subfamily A3